MEPDRSLLLVDDEPGIRTVLSLSLADRGYRVRTAADAEEALRLFRADPAAVVLTDIRMPGMDGLELLRVLKSESPDTEVVLISGHGDLAAAIQGIKLDATDFVTKPISDDALEIALSRAFERRGLRRAVREHAEELERLVEEKSRALVAAERFAAVGQTVAGLAHAIKNMASGLEGGIFLLGEGLEKDRREYLEQGWEMLRDSVGQLKELSLRMLRFSRPEVIRPAVCDPALPARQVAELLGPKAAAAGVRIELDAPPDASAFLDVEAMHQALMNLVGNAIDACSASGCGENGREGLVRIRAAALPGGGARYDVADNGCGLSESARGRLFTAFYSTKGENGTGLGLLGTKKIVEAHGGTVDVRSVAGGGTEFSIIIPGKNENKIP